MDKDKVIHTLSTLHSLNNRIVFFPFYPYYLRSFFTASFCKLFYLIILSLNTKAIRLRNSYQFRKLSIKNGCRNLTLYILTSVSFALISVNCFAQDPQFSQYYNAPLYLNPAFTGAVENTRAAVNYRIQWPGLAPFRTFAASFDHNIEPYNSGVGIMIKRDTEPTAGLSSTDISLLYSYQVYLDDKWTFRPALQAGIVQRSVDFYNLTFGDQLGNNGLTGTPTSENLNKDLRYFYPDFSTGALLHNEFFWIGVSAHHLNKPNQSFTGERNALPVKTSIHAGYKILLDDPGRFSDGERSIIPTFNYKRQGRFNQLDLGVHAIYEPVMFGLWYRGVPLKVYEGIPNHESLIFLAGLNIDKLSFGYSFDLPLSKLNVSRSAGAHEISLIYEWEIPYAKKKKRRRPIPCPKFK